MKLEKASLAMCGLYAICAIAIVFDSSTIDSIAAFLVTSIFSALVFCPQLALYFSVKRQAYKYEKYIMLIVQLLFFVLSIFIYLKTLKGENPDAQGALILIWLPIWQLLGAFIVEAGLWLIRLLTAAICAILKKK